MTTTTTLRQRQQRDNTRFSWRYNQKHGNRRFYPASACWSQLHVMYLTVAIIVLCSTMSQVVVAFILPSTTTTTWRTIAGRQSTVVMMSPPQGAASRNREDEIRRKIMKLKKEGKIKKEMNDSTSSPPKKPSIDEYDDKIKSKLGKRGLAAVSSKLGRSLAGIDPDNASLKPPPLPNNDGVETINDDDDDGDWDEEELVDFVAKKLAEQENTIPDKLPDKLESDIAALRQQSQSLSPPAKTTTGVGGSWTPPPPSTNGTSPQSEDTYKPSRGSWGYFPRPKDISKTYGGGRRIGPGFTKEDEMDRLRSEEATRKRLKEYRQKVGIEVQSEIDNSEEIEEALSLAGRAMQRGIYSTAVSVLEKITKYCSTNSPLGGKVFLELAMAYEATGSTDAAISIYATLSKSRIESIKHDAQRLLYGIEAINFMRNEARDSSFNRKTASQLYIQTTGLDRIPDNFDDKYQTAYVDLDKGGNYYKRLTESVVRSTREARQILIRGVSAEEVDRFRVVQALRSVSRSFDAAWEVEQKEREDKEVEEESVAVMNGKPIAKSKPKSVPLMAGLSADNDPLQMEFKLSSPDLMLENLKGEWRLQLMADQKGDAVKFYNSTLSYQIINPQTMTFEFYGPSGFLTVNEKGSLEFDNDRRVLKRRVENESFLSGVLTGGGKKRAGAAKAGLADQQVMLVDEVLCVTRWAREETKGESDGSIKRDYFGGDKSKEYFCVWRKVEEGTFSKR